MKLTGRFGFTAIVVLFLIAGAVAHVPLISGEHDHLDEALVVENPTKSWVVYDQLEKGGEAHYYRLPMDMGDRLTLTLIVPESRVSIPILAVLRPGVGNHPDIPSFIEVPDSYRAIIVTGESTISPDYEPFTPAAIYPVAEYQLEITEAGTYYAVVYTTGEGGPYSLAIGYKEEFSPAEWILVPLNLISIHIWEGQPLWLILAPVVAVLVCGGMIVLRSIQLKDRFSGLMAAAGLMYIGGSMVTLVQMGIALTATGGSSAAILTMVFIAIPVIIGAGAIRWALKGRAGITLSDRLLMAGCGLLGLVTWAGLLIGPVFALIGSILPESHTEVK